MNVWPGMTKEMRGMQATAFLLMKLLDSNALVDGRDENPVTGNQRHDICSLVRTLQLTTCKEDGSQRRLHRKAGHALAKQCKISSPILHGDTVRQRELKA